MFVLYYHLKHQQVTVLQKYRNICISRMDLYQSSATKYKYQNYKITYFVVITVTHIHINLLPKYLNEETKYLENNIKHVYENYY